jgi:hypothetical protein
MAYNTIVSIGGTANLPATNEMPVDMSGKRKTSLASLTTLTTILSRLSAERATNFRVDLIEEHDMPNKVQIATTEASASTPVVVVAYGTSLVVDTLLFNPRTMDLRLVSATPTSNSVAVTVDQGGTTSAIWQSGDEVFVLPPSLAEDDETFRPASVQDTNVYNYIQLCKLQYSITRVENAMSTHFGGPGSKRAQLKRQKYREFRTKSEQLRYFGGRASSGTAPATKYQQGGLVHFLKNGTLYKDFNGLLTESGWNNFIGDIRDQNPDRSVLNCFNAPNVNRQIRGFARSSVRISPDSTRFGVKVDQYVDGPVTCNLIDLPLLTDAQTKGWGWVLDLDRIWLKDVEKTMFYPDAKTVGESERIYDTYREVTSMLLANEEAHAMFIGATL